ncbi:MAG: MBL fold metallo-hydrolase [Candidatus Thorarchaeota archaeon]
MKSSSIIKTSGKITDDIFHLDLNQYNIPRSCSVFLLITPQSIVIMDIGTSNDVKTIFECLKTINLPLKNIRYLVPSHHHFDHFGGGWKLWNIIKKFNPQVKVLTTEETKKYLQKPQRHLNRAKRTFGERIGLMKPLPEEAYEITELNESIPIPGLDKQFKLLPTPGHTSDHVCPVIEKNGQTEFVYLSECAGGLLHSKKLLTVPSSMPPDFNFGTYIQSLRNVLTLKSLNVGYAHAGAVRGQEVVKQVLEEHIEFSFFFRDFVKKKFTERKKTRYVVEQFLDQEMKKRSEAHNHELYVNYVVAVVYGQLVDLGLKKPK